MKQVHTIDLLCLKVTIIELFRSNMITSHGTHSHIKYVWKLKYTIENSYKKIFSAYGNRENSYNYQVLYKWSLTKEGYSVG